MRSYVTYTTLTLELLYTTQSSDYSSPCDITARSSSERRDGSRYTPNSPTVPFAEYSTRICSSVSVGILFIFTQHVFTKNTINAHTTKQCTSTPTHWDMSTLCFQCRVTTNPDKLAVDESMEITRDGKSCNNRELKLSGQCSMSYTWMHRLPTVRCFAGTDWPD